MISICKKLIYNIYNDVIVQLGVNLMRHYCSIDYTRERLKTVVPRLAFSPDTDFSKWRLEAKKKLEELLGLPDFEKCDPLFTITSRTQSDEFERIDFEFQSEEGYFIPAVLLVPNGVVLPRPTVICLQGHTTGMHISLGIKKHEKDPDPENMHSAFAVQAVKNGLCAIAIDQRHMGEKSKSDTGHPGCFSPENSLSALMLGRTTAGERVWDVMRLIDVIENCLTETVDPRKLILIGNSGGGTATFYTACLEERLHMAVPSCAVCTYDDSIMAMYHCCCNYIPNIRLYFNMGDLGCLIAPKKYIQVNGSGDGIFPIAGAEKSFDIIKSAYSLLGKGDLCRHIKGNGGHQFFPDDVWPVILEMLNK